jgi:type I restriction enzyme S subunit
LKIVHPSNNIDKEFDKLLNPLDAEIENLTLRTINLRKSRDLILPKLISGEIDVGRLVVKTELRREQDE